MLPDGPGIEETRRMGGLTPATPSRLIGHARSSALVVSALLALLFTGGCAPGHPQAVRPSSTKTEERIVLTRRPRDVAVEVSEAAFHAAMFRLAAEIQSLPRPFEGQFLPAAWHPQGAEERLLADGFRLWCGRKQAKAARSGCESILEGDGRWLKLESREAMALSIAMSSVWDGAAEVVKGMVDPVALQAMVYTSLATCMALLLVPEPITKVLMVAITVGLCTYLGWSTVWGILQGWRRLRAEASAARTFGELSAAGERFGKLLGANTARVMVMVTAMALGSTAGAAISGPGASLPAWGQAAQLAAAEGLAPALVAPVASVVAVGETLTVGMAVGSNVVMAVQAPPDAAKSTAPPQSARNDGGARVRLRPESIERGMEIDPSKAQIFRGGTDFTLRPGDMKVDPVTRLVKPSHGLSLDANPAMLERFGGAHQSKTIPPELKIVQRGSRLEHFEIVPREPMTPEHFQELLRKVELD